MSDGTPGSDRRLELIEVIHRVRNRWRLQLAMRGAVVVIVGTLLALLLSASGLEALRFSPAAIIGFRLGALAVFAGLVAWALVRPLRRRVSDSQVAMYLEEDNPTLQAAIISAVETSAIAADDSPTGPSPRLVERLVEQAIEQCRATDTGFGIERQKVKRYVMTLAGVTAVAALLLVFGPAFLRQGISAMLIVYRSAEASSPYHIDVRPGNTKVPRGSDQTIAAKLLGFASTEAKLMVSLAPGAPFETVPLLPGKDPSGFEGILFHVDKTTAYYVESNGVKSPTYTMTVVDLPTVDKLVLEYRFPAYTGLQPRTVDPGGDIAVMPGTQVVLKISPTMATNGGRVQLNETEMAALSVQADGTLTGSFTVAKQGFYRIELDGPHGEKVTASPQYTIDVLNDMEPTVSFTKPGRDTSATTVEEVFAEVKADDDFGVKQVQMFYSVNGGPEKTINLFSGPKTLTEVSASHTLYLEEMGLKPGDFVSYYAKATDNDAIAGSKTATSDIFFVEIRPFRKDYKPAQSAGGGGGGGGGGQQGEQVGQMSRQQREIMQATFNINRDRAAKKLTPQKLKENVSLTQLAQARLREQVEELSGKMNSRLDVVDPALKTIAEALPKAIVEMKAAEGELSKQNPQEALNPEGRALKLLQDAEQQYEVQVQAQRGGGGGGGGGQQMAQDLADLFELELDKLASQYELQQRAETQTSDQKVDELVDKLKELARRQQQEAERQRRLSAAAQSGGGGGSSDSQRQLAQELEEAARRLEQLQREQPRQQQNMADAARQLRDAAQAMRQAAANGSRDGGAQAQAALDKLQKAQQTLQRNQGGRLDRDLQDAQRKAQELGAEAKNQANEVNQLAQAQPGARQGRQESLAQRKDELAKEVEDLKARIDRLANESRTGNQRQTARKLDEAAGAVTDRQIPEAARYTARALRQGHVDRNAEQMIPTGLDEVSRRLNEAQAAMGQASKQDAAQQAADRAGNLRRSMESQQQRMAELQRQAQQGQQGQQGQGQQGQGQQAAQQGQSQQQGQGQQAGQQGQGQQGQQQGQGQGQQQAQSGQSGGQRGGDQNGANRNGGPYGGGDAWAGGWWNGGWWNGNWSGVWTDDMRRQYQRTAQEWQNDFRNLQRELNQAGINPRDFEDVQRILGQLNMPQAFVDPANLQSLLAAAADKMKQAEFNIRKKAEGNDQPLSLSASDEVPAAQRALVEEYYRAIAKKQ